MDILSNLWIGKRHTQGSPGLTIQQTPDFILETMLEEALLKTVGLVYNEINSKIERDSVIKC